MIKKIISMFILILIIVPSSLAADLIDAPSTKISIEERLTEAPSILVEDVFEDEVNVNVNFEDGDIDFSEVSNGYLVELALAEEQEKIYTKLVMEFNEKTEWNILIADDGSLVNEKGEPVSPMGLEPELKRTYFFAQQAALRAVKHAMFSNIKVLLDYNYDEGSEEIKKIRKESELVEQLLVDVNAQVDMADGDWSFSKGAYGNAAIKYEKVVNSRNKVLLVDAKNKLAMSKALKQLDKEKLTDEDYKLARGFLKERLNEIGVDSNDFDVLKINLEIIKLQEIQYYFEKGNFKSALNLAKDASKNHIKLTRLTKEQEKDYALIGNRINRVIDMIGCSNMISIKQKEMIEWYSSGKDFARAAQIAQELITIDNTKGKCFNLLGSNLEKIKEFRLEAERSHILKLITKDYTDKLRINTLSSINRLMNDFIKTTVSLEKGLEEKRKFTWKVWQWADTVIRILWTQPSYENEKLFLSEQREKVSEGYSILDRIMSENEDKNPAIILLNLRQTLQGDIDNEIFEDYGIKTEEIEYLTSLFGGKREYDSTYFMKRKEYPGDPNFLKYLDLLEIETQDYLGIEALEPTSVDPIYFHRMAKFYNYLDDEEKEAYYLENLVKYFEFYSDISEGSDLSELQEVIKKSVTDEQVTELGKLQEIVYKPSVERLNSLESQIGKQELRIGISALFLEIPTWVIGEGAIKGLWSVGVRGVSYLKKVRQFRLIKKLDSLGDLNEDIKYSLVVRKASESKLRKSHDLDVDPSLRIPFDDESLPIGTKVKVRDMIYGDYMLLDGKVLISDLRDVRVRVRVSDPIKGEFDYEKSFNLRQIIEWNEFNFFTGDHPIMLPSNINIRQKLIASLDLVRDTHPRYYNRIIKHIKVISVYDHSAEFAARIMGKYVEIFKPGIAESTEGIAALLIHEATHGQRSKIQKYLDILFNKRLSGLMTNTIPACLDEVACQIAAVDFLKSIDASEEVIKLNYELLVKYRTLLNEAIAVESKKGAIMFIAGGTLESTHTLFILDEHGLYTFDVENEEILE